MKIIAAYLLAVLGGNANPDAAAIKKILSSVGVEADGAQVDKLLAELKGKNVNEVIEAGKTKLSAVPSGAAPAPVAEEKKAEVKKEEPKKKEKVEKPPSEEVCKRSLSFMLFSVCSLLFRTWEDSVCSIKLFGPRCFYKYMLCSTCHLYVFVLLPPAAVAGRLGTAVGVVEGGFGFFSDWAL